MMMIGLQPQDVRVMSTQWQMPTPIARLGLRR